MEKLSESEENELVKIIIISIEQYPKFYENYMVKLVGVLVEILKVLQIKSRSSFYHLFKKIISSGFKLLLDTKRANVNSDEEYYLMVQKATKLWVDLMNN